ncbi:DUF6069 family protein [Pseudonocardia eucalypti]|uniref:DUF6069 family protein n=1 Tax=Pseudonocardia eucalypti TaxID=648755 RepID=UPI003CD08F1C
MTGPSAPGVERTDQFVPTRTPALVTLVSLGPILTESAATSTRISLIALHLAAALVLVPVFRHSRRPQPPTHPM